MSITINQNLCDLKNCNQECIFSCPQNKKEISTLYLDNGKLILNESSCTDCLLCVDECPFSAIEIIVKNGNGSSYISNNKNEDITGIENNSYPFEINQKIYKPFDEKNVMFSRFQWDKELKSYKKSPFSGGPAKIQLNQEGYSEIEFAASQAAWSIEDIVTEKELKDYRSSNVVGDQKPKFELKKPTQTNPEELTKWIKKLAKFYGADLIGITRFDRNWFYSHDRQGEKYNFPEGLKSVIVFAVEMDEEAINTTPRMSAMVATGLGYSKTALVRTILASFINKLGYNTVPAGNQVGLSVPLAVMSGLGGYGRHGLLITKPFGSRVRLAKILTDMPLIYDKPDEKFISSVKKFCKTCKTCAEKCPSASITLEDNPKEIIYSKSNNPGVTKFYVNADTCYDFWIKNGGECSRCVSDCEYSHNPKIRHKFANFVIQYFPVFNPVWPKIGKIFRYGGNKSSKKFWKKIKV
jgi:reductive dehalogenase